MCGMALDSSSMGMRNTRLRVEGSMRVLVKRN
jgi:hypothetical protein